jgi:hypothetical protein
MVSNKGEKFKDSSYTLEVLRFSFPLSNHTSSATEPSFLGKLSLKAQIEMLSMAPPMYGIEKHDRGPRYEATQL